MRGRVAGRVGIAPCVRGVRGGQEWACTGDALGMGLLPLVCLFPPAHRACPLSPPLFHPDPQPGVPASAAGPEKRPATSWTIFFSLAFWWAPLGGLSCDLVPQPNPSWFYSMWPPTLSRRRSTRAT